ncbi:MULTISPECIES: hypothetical protein [Janthinobacterium]|uniref:Uncharacterized protein n=1 Tax=Janthinobacterium kumbetense TaxID=2950280 RepID=A0ABT0WL41_9BURK|nr:MULTISPECIES: hypothetical protein [Janthinobacterium]MCM2564777.1 hypothetical protein [Janthinobacterium kumbetense]MDN2671820.1 hypothetical protein [Janthinobacterium sp. SUN026]MDN2676221.1 hypothetical protein [Janthinobacterium sp. SUN033]MDN2714092.1 hypothetical protein [Janthinobacterium sp. SUN120]MDO8039880.1 hypothetical protein [Janthinobacterium sp. SUN137]
MQNQTKLFAFKLAEKQEQKPAVPATAWKVRDGVAVAGCTAVQAEQYRDSSRFQPNDRGQYC